tara:strand:- start:149 stop:586 length:438 start_codon:yes stop_codon:yes gene_type:complete
MFSVFVPYYYPKLQTDIKINDLHIFDKKECIKIIDRNILLKEEKIKFTFNLITQIYNNKTVTDKEKYFFYADKFWSTIILNQNIKMNFSKLGYLSKKYLCEYKNLNLTFNEPIENVLVLEFYLIKLITDESFISKIMEFFRNLFI